jgi:hypothetical protein
LDAVSICASAVAFRDFTGFDSIVFTIFKLQTSFEIRFAVSVGHQRVGNPHRRKSTNNVQIDHIALLDIIGPPALMN